MPIINNAGWVLGVYKYLLLAEVMRKQILRRRRFKTGKRKEKVPETIM